jgi:hypothetical protein
VSGIESVEVVCRRLPFGPRGITLPLVLGALIDWKPQGKFCGAEISGSKLLALDLQKNGPIFLDGDL